MALPIYLAMTPWEYSKCRQLPSHWGWMACHFSSYGNGLTNLPDSLPPNALLILNDRIPPQGHDPERILHQLRDAVEQLQPDGLLLDMQRPYDPLTAQIVEIIGKGLRCPMAVTEPYLENWSGAVLAPPVPPYITLNSHLEKWGSRPVWLETDQTGVSLQLTENGCSPTPSPAITDDRDLYDETLFVHYRATLREQESEFYLYRTEEDTKNMLEAAETLGVCMAIGLYQQWEK